MTLSVSLPPETWRLIQLMVGEHPVPRHAAFPAIYAFEQAIQAAQQPAAPTPQPAPTEAPE